MKQKLLTCFSMFALFVLLVVPQTVSAISEDDVKAGLVTLNDQLAAAGKNFEVAYVEFLTHDEVGIRVYAKDHELQLPIHWFPYDPMRWDSREIYWLTEDVDQTADVPWADAKAAVARGMNTWNSIPCANIPLVQWDDFGIDWGIVQYFYWGDFPGQHGGSPFWYADLTHAGWLPRDFFDSVHPPNGGDNILGVTYTFNWNAYPDRVAFKEIYFNDRFVWGIDDETKIDVETVAFHEQGHGLSMGHNGMIFRNPGNGNLQFAPRAVMNAIYWDIQHDPLTTDTGAFCSIWASWPNN
ncbi:MAG: hypothetical protein GY950_26980 [bacterium]|nr:hypothetical protein [bacterium]